MDAVAGRPKLELDPASALREIADALPRVLAWTRETRDVVGVACRRFWHPPAGTFVYHTTAAVEHADPLRLEQIANVFLHANELERQPWYGQFQSGRNEQIDLPLPEGVAQAFLGQARFDFGLGRDRFYDQLIAHLRPDAQTHVIGLRSVEGLPTIEGAVRAYTLCPTADVFELVGDRLLWHHVVTVSGAAILPPTLDRWLMNALRFARLDGKERRTYLDEAKAFVAFCGSAELGRLHDELARGQRVAAAGV